MSTTRSVAVLSIVFACTTAPITGRKELNLVGDGTMNQLGEQTYTQELAKVKPSSDQAGNAMVQRVAKRIADAAEANFHPGYQWQATLIDDPKTVNAWCLPGGKIAVYSGILPLTQDEAGLAVVLGHETSHALAQHSAERLSRTQLMQLGQMRLGESPRGRRIGELAAWLNADMACALARFGERDAARSAAAPGRPRAR